MTTITAKELRDNLGAIGKRVNAGEHVRISYRNKDLFDLKPLTKIKSKKENLSGLKAFLDAPKTAIPSRYKTGNLKELYREDMALKYGINK